jgi:hypothetical protein
MRENRQSGSEGGETFGLPYPYPGRMLTGLDRQFAAHPGSANAFRLRCDQGLQSTASKRLLKTCGPCKVMNFRERGWSFFGPASSW